jgi:spermatogenesis-associated protein 2
MAGNSISHRNHLEDVRNCRQHHQQEPAVKDLEETLMELRLEEFHKALPAEHRPLKINEALQKIRMETDSEPCNRVSLGKRSPSIDAMDGSGSVYDNMSSPPKDNPERERPVTVSTAASKSNLNFSALNKKASTRTLPRDIRRYGEERERSSLQAGTHYSSTTLDPRNLQGSTNHYQLTTNISDSTTPEQNVAVGESSSKVRIEERQAGDTSLDVRHKSSEVSDKNKWECVTCTFRNVPSCDICEMCGKSKVRGPEVRPLASGGRECPQCTLVNEKGVGTCEACGSSLKDSPTYI